MTSKSNAVHLRMDFTSRCRANDADQLGRIISPSAIHTAIRNGIIAHLALHAPVILTMPSRLDTLFQYFVDDGLTNLRPAPPGEKSGKSEFSVELPGLYV